MRSPFALFACAILASACSKSTDAPVAASVSVSSSALTFASINQTAQLAAAVLDQSADTMPGLAISWSTSSSAIATVSPAGLVTAKGNGTATVTATSGSVHADVAVTVAQVSASITKSGDGQNGTVGQALTSPLGAHVVDALGTAISGATVTFAVTSGGGSVGTPSATTNASGDATTTWTLGTSVTASQAASATAGVLVTNYSATPSAGAVAAVVIQSGNNQTGATGNPVTVRPSVKVTDSFGNPRSSISVFFQVTAGGGSVTGATQFTDAQGKATVGSWTLGSAGTNSLSVTAQGTSAPVIAINATALTPGAAASVAVFSGNNQTALVGYKSNVRPSVRVADANNLPVGGVSVTFAIAAGGGSLTTTTVNTNSLGIAQVGSWTVGSAPGANSVTATASGGGITGNPVTFTATAASPTFTIVIQNVGPAFTAPVQAAFDSAIAFWQRSIYRSVGTTTVNSAAGQCGTGSPPVSAAITDLRILARIDSIDGPGQILGSAGPCFLHNNATSQIATLLGTMRFDSADMAGLVSNGLINAVIRHEMGHVLGFVSGIWAQPAFGCFQNSSSASVQDTYFSCLMARAAFDSIGGTSYTGGNKVPLENCGPASPAGCGQGTVNSHWREPTFFNEMMTGYLNSSVANPASLLTLAAMEDMGYVVNYAAAESYSRVFTAPPSLREGSGVLIDLSKDEYTGPIYRAGRNGRPPVLLRPGR